MKIPKIIILCLLIPQLAWAAPGGRTRSGSEIAPYNYPSSRNVNIPTQTASQIEERDLGPNQPNQKMPEISPISAQPNYKKTYKPWEYERIDDSLARELQEDIDASYLRDRIYLNPLSPNRIKELRRDSMEVDEAWRPLSPEAGVSRFKTLSLEPGAAIPDVNLFPGNTATIRFMDSTGAPWPILYYMLGDSKSFNVQSGGGATELATNILIITPTKNFADTSLAVTLAPDIPAVIRLHSSVKNSKPDYLVTFRADAPGPNAKEAMYRAEKSALVDETMLSFLDGIPPKGAQKLKAQGNLRAWLYKGMCYIRTDQSLIWPAYKSIVRANGAHAMRVYELPKVSSVVLDEGGKPQRIKLNADVEMTDWERNIREIHGEQMKKY